MSTIGVDLLAFSTLQFLQAGGINYSPLFALPVLMGSVLGSPLLALGTAAGVTLLLLTDAWLGSLHVPADTAARFLQAGLTGTGYFALAVLANQLAARLAREEERARAQASRRRGCRPRSTSWSSRPWPTACWWWTADCACHAANPAARLPAGPRSCARCGAASRWLSQPGLGAAGRRWRSATFAERSAQVGEIALDAGSAAPARMRVRTRLTPSHEHQTDSLCVIFLEDLREIEARLRTEKLAAMGRMSAAVAHEIRNPLAAIAQANALMEEDLREPALQAAERAGAQERAAAGPDRRRDPGHLAGAAPGPGRAGGARTGSGASPRPAATGRCRRRSGARLQLALAAPAAPACRSTPNTCAACW